jgi:hypothetical protein
VCREMVKGPRKPRSVVCATLSRSQIVPPRTTSPLWLTGAHVGRRVQSRIELLTQKDRAADWSRQRISENTTSFHFSQDTFSNANAFRSRKARFAQELAATNELVL